VGPLAPELVQAASVSPRLTAEDVDVIWNGGDWTDTEVSNLSQTALMAQISARTNPLARRRPERYDSTQLMVYPPRSPLAGLSVPYGLSWWQSTRRGQTRRMNCGMRRRSRRPSLRHPLV